MKKGKPKSNTLMNIILAVLPALIVAGLVFGANTYSDLDLQNVIIREMTRIYNTATQLRLAYSDSQYADFSADANGQLTIDPTSGLLLLNTAGIQNYFRVYSTSTDYLQLTHSGLGGILQVSTGDIEIGSAGSPIYLEEITFISASSSTSTLTVTQSGTGNIVEFKDAETSVFTIADGGNVTVAGYILPATTTAYDLGSSTYKWRNLYVATTTIGSTITIGSNTFEGSGTTTLFTSGNSNQFVLGANGYIGIGTTTPAYTLDVDGQLRTTATATVGAFVLPTGAQSGYVLTSNASGVGTWQAAGAAAADNDWIIENSLMYATTTVTKVSVGTTTASTIFDIWASTTATALTVTQSGTGNIVEFKDAETSVFTISDGGYVTLAVVPTATSTAFLIQSPDSTWATGTETYFGISATSTFDGNFIDLQINGVSKFKVDELGNLILSGALKNVATKIVAATNTPDKYARADYVCDGTNDQEEINSAINALAADQGGIVYLLEGNYFIASSTNNIGINITTSSVALIGSGKGTILHRDWDSTSNDGVVEVGDGGTTTVSGVVIANLSIDGCKATSTESACKNKYEGAENIGIFFNEKVTQSRIQNTWVHDCYGYGIYLYASSDANSNFYNQIKGNILENSSSTGISLIKSDHNTIAGNTIQGNGSFGIELESYAEYNAITGNTIYDNTSNGIEIFNYSRYNAVTGNTIRGNANGIRLVTQADNNAIAGNTIQGNSDDGIDIWISDNNVISGNSIVGNSQNGIYVYQACYYNNISSNTIRGNDQHGIYLYYANRSTVITGNKIHDNGGSGAYDGIRIHDDTDNTLISSNDITDTAGTGYAVNISSSDCDDTYLIGNRYSGTGASSINDSGTNTTIQQRDWFEIEPNQRFWH